MSTARIALVTGAGRGIGRAVALRLSVEGMRVALLARDQEQLEKVAAECPGPTLVLTADVTNEEQLEAAFAEIEQTWGAVEVLVANAGTGASGRVEKTSDADWQHMLDLNLTAPFRCFRRAIPAMRVARWGRIVAIASTASLIGEPYIAAYTASKHGVLGLVRSSAAELASSGITVNAVCPAYVDTDMTQTTIDNIVATTGKTPVEARHTLELKQPIGRLIAPDEVAAAVWHCVTNAAVTGQAVAVDGGVTQ